MRSFQGKNTQWISKYIQGNIYVFFSDSIDQSTTNLFVCDE